MRRGILTIMMGLAAALVAYCCVYALGTATPRRMMRSGLPELAWLRQEFNLTQEEYSRVTQLHANYLGKCRERCMQIEKLGVRLSKALTETREVTQEIESILQERAQTRALCQVEMLRHFFEVSRTMPPDQGDRYLVWVRENTCLREQPMDHGDGPSAAAVPPVH